MVVRLPNRQNLMSMGFEKTIFLSPPAHKNFNFWVKQSCIVPKLHFFASFISSYALLSWLSPSLYLSPPVQNFTAITATHFVAMPKISQNLKQRRPFGGRLGDRPSRRRVPSLSRKSKRGILQNCTWGCLPNNFCSTKFTDKEVMAAEDRA